MGTSVIDNRGTLGPHAIDSRHAPPQTETEGNTSMSSYPPPGPGPAPGSFSSRIEEAVELIEMELRHAIAYVNDAVVPQVRKESITAMRSLSDTLRNLADRIERHQNPPRGPQS